MEANRKQLLGQGKQLRKDIQESTQLLKKARKAFDQSNKDLVDCRIAMEKARDQSQLGTGKELCKLQAKTRVAEERFNNARRNFRLQEEALKSMQTKLYSQELPRIMTVQQRMIRAYFLHRLEAATPGGAEKPRRAVVHPGIDRGGETLCVDE